MNVSLVGTGQSSEGDSREIINGNVTENGLNEAKRIWMGKGISCVPV